MVKLELEPRQSELELTASTVYHYPACSPGTVIDPSGYMCKEHAKGIRNYIQSCPLRKKTLNLDLVISHRITTGIVIILIVCALHL